MASNSVIRVWNKIGTPTNIASHIYETNNENTIELKELPSQRGGQPAQLYAGVKPE